MFICLLISVDSFAQWRFVQKFNDSGEEHWVSEDYSIDENGYYIIKLKRIFPKKYKDNWVIKHHYVIETNAISHDLKKCRTLYEVWYDNDGNISEKKDKSYQTWYPMPSGKVTSGIDAAYSTMREIIQSKKHQYH